MLFFAMILLNRPEQGHFHRHCGCTSYWHWRPMESEHNAVVILLSVKIMLLVVKRAPSTGSEKPLLLPCIYSQFSAGSSTAGLIPDVWPMVCDGRRDIYIRNSKKVVKLDEVQRMRNAPDLFNKLVDSISPTVFGHQDIKRALLLMLFGGVHNFTHEGVNLREDIDACIVGDPSCAKSQSLKYTSGIVPRSVYTSGKSSSATGLTATVAKEPETAEFCIEVAIHEAMEQQAISITKAVMQATLNARTSILAAVNPTGGHFDKSKPLKYNVVLPPSILSRFDLVYVMIGDPNNQTDTTLRTILGDTTVGSRVAYRMTVRQLEALIRLYEAIARIKEIDLSEIQEANHDDGVGALVMRLRQHEEAVMRDGRNLNNDGSGSWTLFSYCPSLIRKEGYLIVVDYGSRPEAEGDGARQSSSKDDRILAVAPNYVVE
ncbi:LOW QUALITY PROTEIN: hypothetical protein NC653_009348 [Populus alba x Populus x berolinensis]|uniref:MCM C-terminal AAA(+) ATPase domain-containing protein n=1 Tax=Populus alba x Populus x berolinensis TaxID=444605 RepID=A0AAD6R8P9_9ROSI|nr:LOW QUALITY PROTEIN: hypothetical protein NC653_009348 [Populus alba x Populus x berolinensis]